MSGDTRHEEARYGEGSEPLTWFERARLRRSVNVSALERWLTATDGSLRRSYIAHFASEVTPDDLRASHRELGSTEEALSELERTLAAPPPPEGEPVRAPGGNARERPLTFRFIPTQQLIVQFTPPDDPSLRALWDAIEPSVHG